MAIGKAMMLLSILSISAVTLVLVASVQAAIVEGEVTALKGSEIRVELKSSVVPQIGDSVTIMWLLDGERLEAGHGKVTQIKPSHIVVVITEGDPSGMIGMIAHIETGGAVIEKPVGAATTGKSKAIGGTKTRKTAPAEKVESPSPLPYFLDKQTSFAWTVFEGASFPGGYLNWPDAVNQCSFLERGGLTDWYLPTLLELEHLYTTGAVRNGEIELGGCCAWSTDIRTVRETGTLKLLFGKARAKNFGFGFDFKTGRSIEKALDETVPPGKHNGLHALCVSRRGH